MIIQLKLNIIDSKVQSFITLAIKNGFVKANERTAWNDKDKKEAIRFLFERIIREY